MFSIPRDSEAFRILESMVNDPDTRYIRVAVREHDGGEPHRDPQVMLCKNQNMWTHPLKVEAVAVMLDKTNADRRVELVHTSDPHTQLKPGDRGTVRWQRFDGFSNTTAVDWDSGSGLRLIDGVDQYRFVKEVES